MRSTKIIKMCSSSLCTCLHHMVILRTRNKITDFLMILAWASPFKRSFTPMERRRDDVVLCRARIGHAYFTNGYLLRGELRPMCCGGEGCHLRVVPPGQLLRRPSTPKRFCLLPFIKPGFSIFLT